MNLYAILGICFVPLFAFLLISLILNKNLKFYFALFACLLGLLTVIPTSFIQYFLVTLPIFEGYTFFSLFVTAIIFNGLIEETMKMIFLIPIPHKKQNLSSFFCCAILAGLTIGSVESVIYILQKFQEISLTPQKEIITSLLLKRTFTSQLIHAFCAGLSGLYLWNFKNKKITLAPFIYAILLHGIYNFFAGFTSFYQYLSIVAILLAAVECRIFYLTAKQKNN